MMKKVLLILLICLLTLVGCGKKEDDKKEKEEKKDPIVGKWAHDSYVYTFNEDKTCSYLALGNDMQCTYEVDGDKLSILFEGNTHPFETTFKIENKTLTIKDSFDNDVEYKKK